MLVLELHPGRLVEGLRLVALQVKDILDTKTQPGVCDVSLAGRISKVGQNSVNHKVEVAVVLEEVYEERSESGLAADAIVKHAS